MKGMFDYEENKCEEAILEVLGEYVDDEAVERNIKNLSKDMDRVKFVYGDHAEGSDMQSLYQSAIRKVKEQTATDKADGMMLMLVSDHPEQDIAKLIMYLPELMPLVNGDITLETKHRKPESDCDEVILALLYKDQASFLS